MLRPETATEVLQRVLRLLHDVLTFDGSSFRLLCAPVPKFASECSPSLDFSGRQVVPPQTTRLIIVQQAVGSYSGEFIARTGILLK